MGPADHRLRLVDRRRNYSDARDARKRRRHLSQQRHHDALERARLACYERHAAHNRIHCPLRALAAAAFAATTLRATGAALATTTLPSASTAAVATSTIPTAAFIATAIAIATATAIATRAALVHLL